MVDPIGADHAGVIQLWRKQKKNIKHHNYKPLAHNKHINSKTIQRKIFIDIKQIILMLFVLDS